MSAEFTPVELDNLIEACVRDLGDPASWTPPEGYPASLALCVIDAVFCIGVRYQGVANLVARYRAYRTAQAGSADTDGVRELLDTFEHLGGPQGWAVRLENQQRTSTRHGILKADAVLQEAHVLARHGAWSVTDLWATRHDGRLAEIKADWCAVPGQHSGVSWSYLLLLAGILSEDRLIEPDPGDAVPGVHLDRMVKRYVAAAVGSARTALADSRIAALVRAAALANGWEVAALEHAIWKFESGRSPV